MLWTANETNFLSLFLSLILSVFTYMRITEKLVLPDA